MTEELFDKAIKLKGEISSIQRELKEIVFVEDGKYKIEFVTFTNEKDDDYQIKVDKDILQEITHYILIQQKARVLKKLSKKIDQFNKL